MGYHENDKMDRLVADVSEIKSDLREHMRRTELLETRQDEFAAALIPLNAHVAMWAGVSKAVTVAGAVVGIAAAVWKFVH